MKWKSAALAVLAATNLASLYWCLDATVEAGYCLERLAALEDDLDLVLKVWIDSGRNQEISEREMVVQRMRTSGYRDLRSRTTSEHILLRTVSLSFNKQGRVVTYQADWRPADDNL